MEQREEKENKIIGILVYWCYYAGFILCVHFRVIACDIEVMKGDKGTLSFFSGNYFMIILSDTHKLPKNINPDFHPLSL